MADISLLRRTLFGLAIFSLFPLGTSVPATLAQSIAQPAQSKFRLVRSTSGSKGHEQGGRYLIDDPRTVFKVPDDRQVLVYVEWGCSVGMHEFEGNWKNPAGKLVAVSDFKLEVRGRNCSGFFTLLLSETSETGVWTLEARVDGETTGEHKFQVVSSKAPEATPTTGAGQTRPDRTAS